MKKIFSSVVLSLALILNLIIVSKTFAIAQSGACGSEAGCPVVGTADASTTGTCDSGLYCSLISSSDANYATNPCQCQKAFGSGLENVRGQAGLSSTSVPAIVGSVIKVILGVSGTVALIFIIWGGIQWMVSKGAQDKIASARKLMTSGMIGIAIIAAAYAITDFVIKQITVIAG